MAAELHLAQVKVRAYKTINDDIKDTSTTVHGAGKLACVALPRALNIENIRRQQLLKISNVATRERQTYHRSGLSIYSDRKCQSDKGKCNDHPLLLILNQICRLRLRSTPRLKLLCYALQSTVHAETPVYFQALSHAQHGSGGIDVAGWETDGQSSMY
jgi:hypothetical protein